MTETYLVPAAGGRPAADHGRSGHYGPGTHHLASREHRLRGGLLAIMAGMADGFGAYRRWQSLALMNDADLARLGLDRRDIARHAMFGAVEEPTRR